MRRKKNKDDRMWLWALGMIAFMGAIGFAIVLAESAKGQDSVWYEFPASEYVAERMVCPECGDCLPRLKPDTLKPSINAACSLRISQTYECKSTSYIFTVTVGACNWIKWGKKIHPKDIDSLVDRQTGRLKDKKKGKGPK